MLGKTKEYLATYGCCKLSDEEFEIAYKIAHEKKTYEAFKEFWAPDSSPSSNKK